MRNASLATRAPSGVLCLQIRSFRWLGEYNLRGELSETERKRTKEKESKFAFFCFLSLFGIWAFQWVTAEKTRKNFSLLSLSPQGCIFPLDRVACRRRPWIRSCTNAITSFSFSQTKSWSLLALAVQIKTLGTRQAITHKGGKQTSDKRDAMAAMRKEQPFDDGLANGSSRPVADPPGDRGKGRTAQGAGVGLHRRERDKSDPLPPLPIRRDIGRECQELPFARTGIRRDGLAIFASDKTARPVATSPIIDLAIPYPFRGLLGPIGA